MMKRVMFVCKKNSARSQMAECFAKTLGKGKIEVTSSGLEGSQVRPEAITTMKDVGIDITDQYSKPLSDFKAQDFDAVISLCGCGVNLPSEWVVREAKRSSFMTSNASLAYQQSIVIYHNFILLKF